MNRARLFAVAAGAVILAVSVAGQAHANLSAVKEQNNNDSTGVRLSLDSLTPVVPRPKDTLELSGTVTNTTDQDIEGFRIELRISRDLIGSRQQIAKIVDDSEVPTTRGVNNGATEVKSAVAPGASAPWSLKVPMSDVGLGSTGVYGLRVDATSQQDSSVTDSTQTFLPWFPTPSDVKPTKVAWLWPLSDWPDRNANHVFLSDRTPIEITPNGRLSRVLDLGIAAGPQADWIVDPQVLDAVSGMTSGYQVAGPEGIPVSGGSTQPAIDWINRARAGLAGASVNATAYAVPDVTALTRSKMTQDVVQATTTSAEAVTALLGRPVANSIAWPPGTRTDAKTLSLLQKSGVRTVILDSTALQPSTDGSADRISAAVVRTESGPLSAVLSDRVLSSSLGSATGSAADAVLARQRFFAETGVITASAPNSENIVAVAPDPRWDPNSSVVIDVLAALRTSPWMRSTGLPQLLAATPKDVPRSLSPMTAGAKRAALNPAYLDRIQNTQDKLDVFSAILDEPGQLTEKYSTALLRTTSGSWRTDASGGNKLLASINKELTDEMNRVHVLSGGVKNFSSETGQIPITIANDLPVPVTVGMTLIGDPPIRLSAQPFGPITIPANRKISTQITAQVRGNGELPVKVQLTTRSGTPYGEPAQVTLRSSAYANAATWVVAIAFVALALLLLANSIRRRRSSRDETSPDDGGPGDDGPGDDPAQPVTVVSDDE